MGKLTKFVEFSVFDKMRKCEIPRGPATLMKSFKTLFLRTYAEDTLLFKKSLITKNSISSRKIGLLNIKYFMKPLA